MSATTQRVPLAEATMVAVDLAGLLADVCLRIAIAGSIRRRRPTIGDIDLVCEPKTVPALDLFGEPMGPPDDLLDQRCEAMTVSGRLEKRLDKNGRACWGRELKRATFRGLNVDIQAVFDRDTWGAWLLIRTGPAEFNKRIVTPKSQGGLLPSGFQFKDGFQLWRYGGRIPTQVESDVFHALDLPWLDPEDRS